MIELAKHIEVLLLENDCVIVPGLGGFIAHYRSSIYNKEMREFYPPVRTIGFNPKLVMNDGLLVQSYMQTYNTDFPDASRKIENVVNALKEKLYQEGSVSLGQVGSLYYNMNGVYEFEPAENGFFTPSLYGLETFTFQKLAFSTSLNVKKEREERLPRLSANKTNPTSWHWTRSIAVVAATILLFFLCSVPVKNTYIDEANYASLGSEGLFAAIRNQSAASSVISPIRQKTSEQNSNQQKNEKKQLKNNVNTLKPVTIKTEKVEARIEKKVSAKKNDRTVKEKAQQTTPKTISTQKHGGNNHIIVASLTNAADAEKVVNGLKQKGYADAQMIVSQNHYRVSLVNYANKADAYQKIKELKKQPDFASAWIFISK
ncbi:SPOR domain-containing protein [Bacteroides gallinaceum]|uniref:HU domain-containing protein n=1 Tax=Bacteroides gallinaceum TaxID=1462571 RepID=UPI0025AA9898|nr:SPOR domain-containing protein [Bacteroides gallinaceum]MDN0079861.1 SPOR domain-containing protein [Bacteroides gallinaceum]